MITPREHEIRLLEGIRTLNLAPDQFIVGGTLALSLRRLVSRNARDADVILSPQEFARFWGQHPGKLSSCFSGRRSVTINLPDGVQLDLREPPDHYLSITGAPDDMRDQFHSAQDIGGIQLSPVGPCVEWKQLKKRPKDLDDLDQLFALG